MPSNYGNSRDYVAIRPIPSPSHVGLKVTARCSDPVYTCESPSRNEVAKLNYERRNYQINACGYRSVSHKPYKEVGEVILDERELILRALGQYTEVCKLSCICYRTSTMVCNDKTRFIIIIILLDHLYLLFDIWYIYIMIIVKLFDFSFHLLENWCLILLLFRIFEIWMRSFDPFLVNCLLDHFYKLSLFLEFSISFYYIYFLCLE